MIAKIELDRFLVVEDYNRIKDMIDLELSYRRVGIRYGSDLYAMDDDECYTDQIYKNEEDGKWYRISDNSMYKSSYTNIDRTKEECVHINATEQVVDIIQLSNLCPKLKYKVLQVVPHTANPVDSLMYTINKLEDKLNQIANNNFAFNAKCNVHVPGIGLITIKEVDYETDFCTEQLQKRLDNGWRIIAVCPQPDQRRPDYILGRPEIPE